MLLISQPRSLFQDTKALLEVLATAQQKSIEKKHSQIVSISGEIPNIDPLAVLQNLHQPNQLHFYWQKNRQSSGFSNDAIAAIDSVQHFTTEGVNRFNQAQNFIGQCVKNTLSTGDLHLPYTGPHFFCSFSFFEHNYLTENSFPPATIFLPRWQVVRYQKNYSILVANLVVHPETNLQKTHQKLIDKIQKITQIKALGLSSVIKQSYLQKQNITDPETFKKSVNSALKSIQNQSYHKIVLANAVDVFSPHAFNAIQSLDYLRQNQPDCYIFSTGNGQGKTFIGASPERLVTVENNVLTTDALAGSAPRGKTPLEDLKIAENLLHNPKEKHEHQVVIDFIFQTLSELGLSPLLSPQIHLLKLSNIQHIWTPIKAQMPAHISLLDVVAKLHPTPAVAGVPREIVCAEIRQYENFNRSLYAAPLGWIDGNNNGEFIVGIRSAIMEGKSARLYAGAGIVAGSIAEKEYAEIQLKLQALLKALI